jgi:polar amino acid transport system substrate-binding protein
MRNGCRNTAEERETSVMTRHALALAGLLAFAATQALARGQPPLRCAVDGTFAPHAMPKLGGG